MDGKPEMRSRLGVALPPGLLLTESAMEIPICQKHMSTVVWVRIPKQMTAAQTNDNHAGEQQRSFFKSFDRTTSAKSAGGACAQSKQADPKRCKPIECPELPPMADRGNPECRVRQGMRKSA
jgi:hypothetical protein